MMYVNYYSKMRSSLNGTYEDALRGVQDKIVTKIVNRSTFTSAQRSNLMTKGYALSHKIEQFKEAEGSDLSTQYEEFKIPKRTGGYRTLHAPKPRLNALQSEILDFITKDCKILCHNAVHSFVKNRNCKTALERHQRSGAHWFLKVDIKDFFDNCDRTRLEGVIRKIHPLSILPVTVIRDILDICYLDGKLPQGAPTSPMLSNLYMQEFDYTLTSELRTYTYTRYADDILISSTKEFDYRHIVQVVQLWLPPGLNIKPDKTRYGSCNGSNWNLGLMYNNQRQITVGYRNKHMMKNIIHNLYTRKPPEGTQEFSEWLVLVSRMKGLLGYYKFIEPVYFTQLILKYKAKGYDL